MMKRVMMPWMTVAVVTLGVYTGLPQTAPAERHFVSPRHSQVSMKGEWYPELQGWGRDKRYHWVSETKGESITFTFEGTSVALVTRTGARTVWIHATHTNSLSRLGNFAVRLDG